VSGNLKDCMDGSVAKVKAANALQDAKSSARGLADIDDVDNDMDWPRHEKQLAALFRGVYQDGFAEGYQANQLSYRETSVKENAYREFAKYLKDTEKKHLFDELQKDLYASFNSVMGMALDISHDKNQQMWELFVAEMKELREKENAA